MIRAIAALDDRLGLATDKGIPWSIPADVQHFRAETAHADVLMGYGTYVEFTDPMPDGTNYVATGRAATLRDGFQPVADVPALLSDHPGDLWIIGGATLYTTTLGSTEELLLTRVAGDFGCTKFFPAFESSFQLVDDTGSPAMEGVPAFRFQTWRRIAPTT